MTIGNYFCNVDLHVHTPKSECFYETGITPKMIVSQALAAGMEAIAITDHNSGEWVDKIKIAAENTELTVFPGVEISIQPGIHVIAIFPETYSSVNITDLLTELGLKAADRGKNNSIVTKYGINEVISIIRKNHALPILAHIDDEKGVWKELKGQTLINLWNDADYAAVEIVGNDLPEPLRKQPFKRIPAYYWASDNPHSDDHTKHSYKGIGNRYSRFKLCKPITWEGLRLCFQDPYSRIQQPGPSIISHPRIEKIQINGGFLNSLDIELNPNLNCLIGGRGTGKSCLLEIIRYTFNVDSKTTQNSIQSESIIDNTFPPGSKASILIKIDENSTYKIERNSGEKPKVYRFGEQEPLDLDPKDIFPINVYGQKEVYEISRDPNFQLRLLDNYLEEGLRQFLKEEAKLLSELEENKNKIIRMTQEVEELESDVEKLGSVNEQIRRLEQENFTQLLQSKTNYDRENELLTLASKKIEHLVQALSGFLSENHLSINEFDEDFEGLPHKQLLAKRKATLQNINLINTKTIHQLIKKIRTSDEKDNLEILQWENNYKEQEDAYQSLLLNLQEDGMGLAPDRYVTLQKEQRRLILVSEELKAISKQLATEKGNRKKLLSQLRINRYQQYKVRESKAQELSKVLENNVRITIWPQGNRDKYLETLAKIFEGTRARRDVIEQLVQVKASEPERAGRMPAKYHGEELFVIPEIPRYLDQIDLAEAIEVEKTVENDDSSKLLQLFSVNSPVMRRNIATITEEKLFELETIRIPDLPIIELKVGGGELGYKRLEYLSIGQKCTALLSLILLENPSPLLIDQPEDDLDNHFIFERIVTTLRNAKEKRQFLIATHNANIPVSGDAELILVLSANDKNGWIQDDGLGSIDTVSVKQYVEHILEGGEDAFRIRKEKYGI